MNEQGSTPFLFWEPWKVALFGILVWVGIRVTAPIEQLFSMNRTAFFYILLCYATFFIGCFVANLLHPVQEVSYGWRGKLNSQLYFFTVVIGIVGFIAKVVDRIYLRGVDYFAGANEVRDALSNTAATPLGALGQALIPFCYLPLMLLLASKPGERYARYLGFSILIFTLPVLESLGQLSRIYILVALFIAFATLSLLRFDGKVFTARLMVPAMAIGLVVVPLSTSLLEARITAANANYTLTDSLYESVFAQTVTPSAAAKEKVLAGSAFERAVYSAVLTNSLYYTSGVYEFSRLMERPDEQPFAYGSYVFWPYTKLVAAVIDDNDLIALQDDKLFYRTGVFTSFFGPWWVDFGWAGPFLLIFFGYGVTRLAQIARRGFINILPIYIYLVLVVFYMPVVNLINYGNGFFALHGFALFALFTSFHGELAQLSEDEGAGGLTEG